MGRHAPDRRGWPFRGIVHETPSRDMFADICDPSQVAMHLDTQRATRRRGNMIVVCIPSRSMLGFYLLSAVGLRLEFPAEHTVKGMRIDGGEEIAIHRTEVGMPDPEIGCARGGLSSLEYPPKPKKSLLVSNHPIENRISGCLQA